MITAKFFIDAAVFKSMLTFILGNNEILLAKMGNSMSYLSGVAETLPPAPDYGAFQDHGTPRYASPLPLIVGIVAVVGSGIIAFFLEVLGAEWWSVLGYLLTPLIAVLATGWDAIAQMSGRKDPWFVIRPALSKVLRILAGVSIVVGVIHIWRISDWLARTAVQQGWPFLT